MPTSWRVTKVVAKTTQHLCNLLFELWKSFDQNRSHFDGSFSYHFVADFCDRNDLSISKMRKNIRSDLNEDEVAHFAKQYMKALSNKLHEYILNMDETPLLISYGANSEATRNQRQLICSLLVGRSSNPIMELCRYHI